MRDPQSQEIEVQSLRSKRAQLEDESHFMLLAAEKRTSLLNGLFLWSCVCSRPHHERGSTVLLSPSHWRAHPLHQERQFTYGLNVTTERIDLKSWINEGGLFKELGFH